MSLPAPLAYAELGYRVFPCQPGLKRPDTAHGLLDATTDAEQIAKWIEEKPNANWAICTDGLLVVDIDPLADGPNPWPQNEQQARDLASTPVISVTPRKGRHFWFQQPANTDYRNTNRGELAPHVDTRATGGYVVVPPSIVNGIAYEWLNGEPEVGPSELPEPSQWILDKLTEKPASKPKAAVETADGTIPDGQRNATLTRIAGAMRRVGSTEDEIVAALQAANANRCKPPLADNEVATIAHSVARYAPADVDAYLASIAAADEDDDGKAPIDPGPLQDDLLNVPGFIGEFIEFANSTAFKRQPALALAGGLSLLATLTGRKITDTQGTRTNLYCIGVAGTSTGKQHAREVIKELLYNAGLEQLIGPESIGSAPGMIAAVEQQPAILCQLDEMGRYLKTMGDAAKTPWLYNIISVMMRLFTDSASVYKSDAVVDPHKTRVKTILNPHLCIHGTTTPTALYDSLSLDSLQDGFLSRVLVFEGDESAVKRQRVKQAVTQSLIDQAKWWGSFVPGTGNTKDITPQPLIVEASTTARRVMYEFEAECRAEQLRLGEPLGLLWPRAVEKANKLALLYACSETAAEPHISDAAALWATELVKHLTAKLTYLASEWVAENRQERGVKRLARLIRQAGTVGISKTGITRATQWLTTRDRDELLNTLIGSGQVALQFVDTARRRKSLYFHRQSVELINS